MEIGEILFSLAMVLLVAAYVLRPLADTARGEEKGSDQQLSALKAEQDRLLDSIREIDADHSMGKVTDVDYQRQRQALTLEAAGILRQLDELQPPRSAEDGNAAGGSIGDGNAASGRAEREKELEAAVAELRGKRAAARSAKTSITSAAGSCPECAKPIYQGDHFCANCGAELEERVA